MEAHEHLARIMMNTPIRRRLGDCRQWAIKRLACAGPQCLRVTCALAGRGEIVIKMVPHTICYLPSLEKVPRK